MREQNKAQNEELCTEQVAQNHLGCPFYFYEQISKSIHRITESKKKISANQTETSQTHLSKQKNNHTQKVNSFKQQPFLLQFASLRRVKSSF